MTGERIFPTATAYAKAVQHPAEVFSAPDLRNAIFPAHRTLGVVSPMVGQFAAVLRAQVHGSTYALRFFTSPAADRARYARLTAHLHGGPLLNIVVASTWSDRAILVNNDWWPMVRMPWIDGPPLDIHVARLVAEQDSRALLTLANQWRHMILAMQASGFAHGDLQHRNVLVEGPVDEVRLRLVDLDGSWIEAIEDLPAPGEDGHPNFRLAGRVWGRYMDTFPGLLGYAALRGLAQDPVGWDSAFFSDKILFDETDFRAGADTPVWRRLEAIDDPALRHALAELRQACADATHVDRPLQELLPWWEVAKEGRTRLAGAGRPAVPPSTQEPEGTAPWDTGTQITTTPIHPPAPTLPAQRPTPTTTPPSTWPEEPVAEPTPSRSPGVYTAAGGVGVLVGVLIIVIFGSVLLGLGLGAVAAVLVLLVLPR